MDQAIILPLHLSDFLQNQKLLSKQYTPLNIVSIGIFYVLLASMSSALALLPSHSGI